MTFYHLRETKQLTPHYSQPVLSGCHGCLTIVKKTSQDLDFGDISPKSKSWLVFLPELWWKKKLIPTTYFYFTLVTGKFSKLLTEKLAEL